MRRAAEPTQTNQIAGAKRKASAEVNGDINGHDTKRLKTASPELEERPETNGVSPDPDLPPKSAVPFPEKPAVTEERNGDISFQVVNNDGKSNPYRGRGGVVRLKSILEQITIPYRAPSCKFVG